MSESKYSEGISLLKTPVLPLARLVILLYLTGPFTRADEVIAELNEEIETGAITYPDPQAVLLPYLDDLAVMETLKNDRPIAETIFAEDLTPLDRMEAVEMLLGQKILTRELETINSCLCRPCDCSLCCRGPEKKMAQEFFEIPLTADETGLFALPLIDTPESRAASPHSGPEYTPAGIPFYRQPAAVYRFKTGTSLIIPREKRCPNLDENDGCAIYPERPLVCRRPQIFAYMIEEEGGKKIARRKLLGVSDCPYVRDLKDEIADYATAGGMELVLRRNKE